MGACISEELFAKDVILASERPLDEMRVADLKAELVAPTAIESQKPYRNVVWYHLNVFECSQWAPMHHMCCGDSC